MLAQNPFKFFELSENLEQWINLKKAGPKSDIVKKFQKNQKNYDTKQKKLFFTYFFFKYRLVVMHFYLYRIGEHSNLWIPWNAKEIWNFIKKDFYIREVIPYNKVLFTYYYFLYANLKLY